jgi:hypothetical protein
MVGAAGVEDTALVLAGSQAEAALEVTMQVALSAKPVSAATSAIERPASSSRRAVRIRWASCSECG